MGNEYGSDDFWNQYFDDEILWLETIYDRQEIPIRQAILGW
jgi:hypothetical protein